MRLMIAAAILLVPVCGAHAQSGAGSPGVDGRVAGPTIGAELDDVHDRISRQKANRVLSKSQARAMHRETAQIGVLANRYGQDGMSYAERREIDMRIEAARSLSGAPGARASQDRPGKKDR